MDFHISATISTWQNIALSSTCTASSTYDAVLGCEKAINGKMVDHPYLSYGEGIGMWIKLTFDQSYSISYVRIMDVVNHNESNRLVKISFDNSFEKQVKYFVIYVYQINVLFEVPEIYTTYLYHKIYYNANIYNDRLIIYTYGIIHSIKYRDELYKTKGSK